MTALQAYALIAGGASTVCATIMLRQWWKDARLAQAAREAEEAAREAEEAARMGLRRARIEPDAIDWSSGC